MMLIGHHLQSLEFKRVGVQSKLQHAHISLPPHKPILHKPPHFSKESSNILCKWRLLLGPLLIVAWGARRARRSTIAKHPQDRHKENFGTGHNKGHRYNKAQLPASTGTGKNNLIHLYLDIPS